MPASGGGLLCGVGLALKGTGARVTVVGVQTAAAPYLHTAFYGGDPAEVEELPTLADGLAGPVEVGSVTLRLLRDACDEMCLVEEEAIVESMRWLGSQGEVVEPAGAVGLACAWKDASATERRVVIVSGGNLDAGLASEVLGQEVS